MLGPMPIGGVALEIAQDDAIDHFVFDRPQLASEREASGDLAPVAADQRPSPVGDLLHEEEAFDFTGAGTQGLPAHQAPVDAAWSGSLPEPGWTGRPGEASPDLDGALAPFHDFEPGMLDYRTPDMFNGSHNLALDGVSALGAEGLRIG